MSIYTCRRVRPRDLPALGVLHPRGRHNNAKDINLLESPELVVEELRSGIYEIGRLTGTVDVEEYLEVIFKEFCIGK